MSTTSTTHQVVAAAIATHRARRCSKPFREALAILEGVNDDLERYAETQQWDQFNSLIASLKTVLHDDQADAA